MSKSVGDRVRSAWDKLSRLPFGKRVFSKMVGRMAPYSGTIGAVVDHLEEGYARVHLADRKAVRNHLNSVHAIALANLGELATGLAMMSGLPSDARGILTGIEMTYVKKARGTLVAECRVDVPKTSERQEYVVRGEIKNASGEIVAICDAKWLIGPRNAAAEPASAAAK